MKTAWLFAGQGSQYVGMGKDFYDSYPQVRPFFDDYQVDETSLAELCFAGPEERLNDTRFTQVAMAAFATAVTSLLRESCPAPAYVAGLSLGEYNALAAAGVFEPKILYHLLDFRGKMMAEASSPSQSMVAVLGLDDGQVEATVDEARLYANEHGLGVVACANFNCPGQVVVSGDGPAVDHAAELLKAAGAKRVMSLKTSGAFHTPLMQSAQVPLSGMLLSLPFKPQRVPVVFNVTGLPAADDKVKGLLTRQIISPVRFAASLQTMAKLGVTRFVEIGPGKALTGFVKKTLKELEGLETFTIQTVEDLEALKAAS
jgi:[acyl-carrier-protein] S-malonyltransferase